MYTFVYVHLCVSVYVWMSELTDKLMNRLPNGLQNVEPFATLEYRREFTTKYRTADTDVLN